MDRCLKLIGTQRTLGCYAKVEKGFKDRTVIVATKSQIKNKWDKLKEDFKAWKKLMLRQTGTG